MRVALQLSPEDRFVLRSSTALYVNRRALDRALELITRSPMIREDPWLLAAAIAVADLSGSKRTLVRDGFRLLERDFPERHLAELAAALGTVELDHGSQRRGRQLLRRSASHPTENALAQVEWIANRQDALLTDDMPVDVPRAFEASARRAAYVGRWEEAMEESRQWLVDQAFSPDAAIFASYCACESEDWNSALDLAKVGLQANADNAALLNNSAFALTSAGRLPEAQAFLERARSVMAQRRDLVILAATEALFLFRAGYPQVGRRRYEAVVDIFLRAQDPDTAAKAALMLAREELIIGSDEAESAWKKADDLARDVRRSDVRRMYHSIEDLLRSSRLSEIQWEGRERIGHPTPLLEEPHVLQEAQT